MWLRDYPSGISLRCVRRSDVPAGAWSWVFVRQLRRPLGQEVSTARALSAAELSAGRSIAYLSYAGIMFAMRARRYRRYEAVAVPKSVDNKRNTLFFHFPNWVRCALIRICR